MRTKLFILTLVLSYGFNLSGQEKVVYIEQPLEKKVSHIRLSKNAEADILYSKSSAMGSPSKLQITSTGIDSGLVGDLRDICKLIDDTLIVYENKRLKEKQIRLLITTKEPISSIVLDNNAKAKIEFKEDIELFKLIANEHSACVFPSSVNADSIIVVGKSYSEITFYDIYVDKSIELNLESKANFDARKGGFNPAGAQSFSFTIGSNIYLFGSKYPRIESNKNKSNSPISQSEDKQIRIGYPGFNFEIGMNSLITLANDNTYNSTIGMSSSIAFWFPINLTKKHSIYTGFSMTTDQINMINPLTIKDGKLTIFDIESEVGISNYNSKITTFNIGIPIVFEYALNSKRKFGIMLGVTPSYVLKRKNLGLINTFERDNRCYAETFNNNNILNRFQLDARFSLNYSAWQLFFDYGLIPLLKTEKEKTVNVLRIGIAVDAMRYMGYNK